MDWMATPRPKTVKAPPGLGDFGWLKVRWVFVFLFFCFAFVLFCYIRFFLFIYLFWKIILEVCLFMCFSWLFWFAGLVEGLADSWWLRWLGWILFFFKFWWGLGDGGCKSCQLFFWREGWWFWSRLLLVLLVIFLVLALRLEFPPTCCKAVAFSWDLPVEPRTSIIPASPP